MRRSFGPWMLLFFVGSGCAALIYEVVWFQLLQLVIGLTTASLGLLLGAFMGGMCLGSLLFSRSIAARHHPLKVYALLELGIGILALIALFALPAISDVYTASGVAGWRRHVLKGILAFVCLLPPTVLMGATLPAMARWVESGRESASWLGLFYAGNIAGAVFGCLLAGFYLLRLFDTMRASLVAVSINLLVAAGAWWMASRSPWACEPKPQDSPGSEPVSAATSQRMDDRTVHLAIALSGFTALGAEVVWTRLLSLLMGGTVYTFSIILAVFLSGLGLGSGLGAWIGRVVERPRLAFGICQWLLIPALAWTSAMISHSLPYWPINPSLSVNPWFNFQLDLARGLWALLPATLVWGASFPLALAAVARPGRDQAGVVGRLYAANTVGAIFGAMTMSLFLVPQWGSLTAQRILAGVAGCSALILLAKGSGARSPSVPEVRPSWFSGKAPVMAVGVLASMAVVISAMDPAPWGMAAYGRFMATYGNRLAPGIYPESRVPMGAVSPDIFCTYVAEGINGTIAVTQWSSGVRNFHSAGKVQASNDPRDMRLQRMLGHLSALACEKPESVLVVACGAGVTAGSFVVHPETRRIVICDIEPLVPRVVAPMFAAENFNVVRDPRTEVVIDDGRHFLRTTRDKFDVITSDPIDPWVKGCAALNTVEYYEACKARLKPGGVMSLWIPLYESSAETVKSIIATFFKVFPNGILWSNDNQGEGYDAVLFGQVEPRTFDLDTLQARLDRPDHERVKRSLSEAGFASVEDLIATYAGRASDLGAWMADAQINNDRDLRLQYLAGWSVNQFRSGPIMEGILQHRDYPGDLFRGSELVERRLRSRLGRKR